MSIEKQDWIRFRDSDFRGIISSELKSILNGDFIRDLDGQVKARGGSVIKESRVRWVASFPIEGGKNIFIKQFRVVDGWQACKYLFLRSRAKREWTISHFLIEKGIPTPRPLGMIERRQWGILRECFFITEALGEAADLIASFKNRYRDSGLSLEKRQTMSLLANMTRKIHDSGLFHRDLHGGNLLVTEGGPLSLFLVDLHQARRQFRVSWAKRLLNIAQIFHSLDFGLDPEVKKVFLLAYGQGEVPLCGSLDSCLKRVEAMVQKLVRRRQKSRAKRCLKESTLFTISRRADHRIFRRREIGEDDLMAILKAHREMVSSQRERLVKCSPKTVVSVLSDVGVNGRRACVKEYRYEGILDRVRNSLRKPRGKVSWVAGNVLFSRGFCPLKPLAYAERRKLRLLQEAFFVTESSVDDMEMDRYLIRRFGNHAEKDLRKFIGHFAAWIGSLNRAGVYHSDLKTCNILVRETPDGWGFSLIDLEDVVQKTTIGIEKILRNLVQINCSIPKSISCSDRMRFMKGYLKANPVVIKKRAFVRRIMEESRRRGIVYVSPDDVVMDKFE